MVLSIGFKKNGGVVVRNFNNRRLEGRTIVLFLTSAGRTIEYGGDGHMSIVLIVCYYSAFGNKGRRNGRMDSLLREAVQEVHCAIACQ